MGLLRPWIFQNNIPLGIFGIIYGVIEKETLGEIAVLRLCILSPYLKHILVVGDNELAFNFIKIKAKKYLVIQLKLLEKRTFVMEVEVDLLGLSMM